MSIAIIGAGIVSAIGNNENEVLDSLLNKKSGIGKMRYIKSEHSDLPVGEVKMSNDEMKEQLGIAASKIVSRTALMGAIAVKQSLQDSGVDLAGKRVAFVNGTTVAGMDVTEQKFTEMRGGNVEAMRLLLHHDCGDTTRDIAEICGLQADQVTISTACSSAMNSIMEGAEMLKNDEADVVIAGGTEALSLFHFNGFNTLMILDKERCRPFDDTRAGINLGEGAAYVVLVRSSEIGNSKARAYVSGYGNACDAFHQTASSEDGIGPYLAMSEALSQSGLEPVQIQYVNAHGTGTRNNDESESAAIVRVFGGSIPPVSSTKAFTGHTTSAAGAIGVVICLLAMENSFLPSNIGWQRKSEGCVIPTVGECGVALDNVMCNSFGFGGNDSSLILSRKEFGNAESAAEFEVEQVVRFVIDDEAQLADVKNYIPMMEARRMGKLMKATMMTSLRVLSESGVECPDAIITATAHGMLETSEKFLIDLTENGETLLKPTLFMQSTHNTLSSAVAIKTHSHGYNVTYSQGKDSMSCAMRNAKRLIRTGKVRNVLVGCHDEATELYRSFMADMGCDVPRALYSESVLLKRKER